MILSLNFFLKISQQVSIHIAQQVSEIGVYFSREVKYLK